MGGNPDGKGGIGNAEGNGGNVIGGSPGTVKTGGVALEAASGAAASPAGFGLVEGFAVVGGATGVVTG
jgi:hypothetical protein